MAGIVRKNGGENAIFGRNLGWSCVILNDAPVQETLHTGQKKKKKNAAITEIGLTNPKRHF